MSGWSFLVQKSKVRRQTTLVSAPPPRLGPDDLRSARSRVEREDGARVTTALLGVDGAKRPVLAAPGIWGG